MSKKNYELEISKMLTLGTCHITEETCNWLSYTDGILLCVYPKDYGFFILTDSSCFGIEAFQELPEDLATILQFAVEKNCSWGKVWVECSVKNYEIYNRPAYQGGAWILADELKITKILNIEEVMGLRKEISLIR